MNTAQEMLQIAQQYHQTNQLAQAESLYRQVIQLTPDNPVALHLLGVVELQKGNSEGGIGYINQAVSVDPSYANAYYDLGRFFQAQGRLSEALDGFKKTIEINVFHEPALRSLGDILSGQDRLDEAAGCYKRALELNSHNYGTANNYGLVLRKQGKVAEAVKAFRHDIALNPYAGSAYFNLVQVEPYLEQTEIDFIKRLLVQVNIPEMDRVYFNLSLSLVFNQQKLFDEAFLYAKSGNDLQRRLINYNHQAELDMLRSITELFDQAYFDSRSQVSGVEEETPVFIIGMPRSGSTLVEQILSTHPSVFGGGETVVLDQVLSNVIDRSSVFPSLASLDENTISRTAKEYLAQLHSLFDASKIITNKKLDNYLYLGVIALMFPQAKIIHCKRNPLDNCLSCFMNWFHTGQYCTYDMNELGEYYLAYERLMEHWKKVLPISILEVQYEDLTENQEAISREILSYCGLEWDPECLDFHENQRSVHTVSDLQVRQPMYKTSVERWRNYEQHLTPLKRALGLVDA